VLDLKLLKMSGFTLLEKVKRTSGATAAGDRVPAAT
jgi:hypothetical protein